MNSKQVERAIQKSAKKVIIESGLASSRAGNKELRHLATKLATQQTSRLEAAQTLGTQLGQMIVEYSQKLNQPHLDAGVVRAITLKKALPASTDLPAKVQTTSPVSEDSEANGTAQPILPPPLPQAAAPIGQTVDEQEVDNPVPLDQDSVAQTADPEMIIQAETDLQEENVSELSEEPLEVAPAEDVAPAIDSSAVDETLTLQTVDTEAEPTPETV